MHATVPVLADLIIFMAVLLPVAGIAFCLLLRMANASHAAAARVPPASGSATQASTSMVVAPLSPEPPAEVQESGRAEPARPDAPAEQQTGVVVVPRGPLAPAGNQAMLQVEPASHALPRPYAQALTDRPPRRVLVICIADTPWGNAGETLLGSLTELADGQKVLCVADEAGVCYDVPLHEPYVHIRELPPH